MDYIFDVKLSQFIYQIEATANWVLDHATEDVNKMVDNFKKEMEQLLNEAIDKAEEFVDHTIEEIK